jgi:hypothetical protein
MAPHSYGKKFYLPVFIAFSIGNFKCFISVTVLLHLRFNKMTEKSHFDDSIAVHPMPATKRCTGKPL